MVNLGGVHRLDNVAKQEYPTCAKAVNVMNRRSLPFLILALLVLTAGVLLLTGRFNGEDRLQASTAIIDPAIWEALETQTEVEVLISLRTRVDPHLPTEEWETALRRRTTDDLQTAVLSVLTEDDFVLTNQHKNSPALAGRITISGLEKLAVHPDVVGIGMIGNGSYEVSS